MKNTDLTVSVFEKLLKKELAPMKGLLESHSKLLTDIKLTQEAHTSSLADIELRVTPLAETAGAVVVDHSDRIGELETKVEDFEPRVSALEAVISK